MTCVDERKLCCCKGDIRIIEACTLAAGEDPAAVAVVRVLSFYETCIPAKISVVKSASAAKGVTTQSVYKRDLLNAGAS